MNTATSAITRASRSIRRAINRRIAGRPTRKASIKLGITISVPPFVMVVFDYKADMWIPTKPPGHSEPDPRTVLI